MTRHRQTRMPIAIGLLIALAACDSGTSMQHTNATTTEQLNQIADNTSETAGRGNAQDMADPTTGGGTATRRRKY